MELIRGRHVDHLVIGLVLLDKVMVRGQHDEAHKVEETHQVGYKGETRLID